ncbi:hypothetical protein D9613_001778 [Agrocybe pediades]|uniref:Protein kinase domain-containing protein n=1 Tax=Agrocybe pediades TaxID=84607 RepID=A0A8H4R519_9AGAR|nr:hypothetical protein D9613_001778 [Agrocybe pediades]
MSSESRISAQMASLLSHSKTPTTDHTLEGSSYFGDAVYDSPPLSESSDSEQGDGAHTDSTLDDPEEHSNFGHFGHPLERMPRLRSADHGLNYDLDGEVDVLLKTATLASTFPSRSSSSTSSITSDTINYERIVDLLLAQDPNPFEATDSRNLVMFDPPKDDTLYRYMEAMPPMMVKRVRRSSEELLLLLDLNRPDLREDPWNAAPHILGAVEKEDYVYLCLQRLSEYNDPPMLNVSHYIDFVRQMLEGLSFLHEQRVAGLKCSKASSHMVDLSSQSFALSDEVESEQGVPKFDRHMYPVRYYFSDFTTASRVPMETLYPASSPPTPGLGLGIIGSKRPTAVNSFIRDVQDCGTFIETLLLDVPQVAGKLKSLTKAMLFGGFNADDARRLFEALCHSIPAEVFNKPATPLRPSARPERAHTIAHPISIKDRPKE